MKRRRRGPKRGTPTTYRGIRYRSKWEVYVAKLLLYSDIKFQYEPQRFFFGDKLSYLPDFYIPATGTYLEVKGYLNEKDKILIKLFSRLNRIVYLGKPQLARIHGKAASNISKLDVVNYVPSSAEVAAFKHMIKSM